MSLYTFGFPSASVQCDIPLPLEVALIVEKPNNLLDRLLLLLSLNRLLQVHSSSEPLWYMLYIAPYIPSISTMSTPISEDPIPFDFQAAYNELHQHVAVLEIALHVEREEKELLAQQLWQTDVQVHTLNHDVANLMTTSLSPPYHSQTCNTSHTS